PAAHGEDPRPPAAGPGPAFRALLPSRDGAVLRALGFHRRGGRRHPDAPDRRSLRMARPRFPHPLALLLGGVLLASSLSHVLPPGEYERRDDPQSRRKVVVAGTFHAVAPHPVGPFEALVAIPKGMADAGAVIFFVC